MAITFDCVCGKRLNVPDGSGGRTLRCPACKAEIVVPAPGAITIAVTDEPASKPGEPSPYDWFGKPARDPSKPKRASNPARSMLVMIALFGVIVLLLSPFWGMNSGNAGMIFQSTILCITIALVGIACTVDR